MEGGPAPCSLEVILVGDRTLGRGEFLVGHRGCHIEAGGPGRGRKRGTGSLDYHLSGTFHVIGFRPAECQLCRWKPRFRAEK